MSRPSPAWRGAHLAVLWGFAILQPLLDLLGAEPEFFVARGNGRADIILLAVGLALVPPALMLAAEWIAGRVRSGLDWSLHLLFVGGLVAAFVLQLAKDVADGPAAVLLAIGFAAGVLGAYVYLRSAPVRSALNLLTPAPAIFVVLFLVSSPAAKLILPEDDEKITYDAAAKSDAPVVVIIFDEIPGTSLMSQPGRIDARRFPNFARLGRHSTWFPYATTIADGTTEAVPALLSGSRPEKDSVPNTGDYPDNFFTLFGGSHELNVVEDATELCPARLCGGRELEPFGSRMAGLVEDLSIVGAHLVLPDALREPLPPVDQSFEDFRGGGAGEGSDAEVSHGLNTRDTALEPFLAGIDSSPQSLHFLHLLIPHFPWEFLPSGQAYPLNLDQFSDGFMDPEGRWYENRELVDHGLERHLLQVGYTDWVLGRVIDRLQAAGIWEEAMVVVTGDHGAAFVPGDYRRQVTRRNYAELASVPIFVKAPNQRRGRVDERHLQTIDVLPTIAEDLGFDLPFETDGIPASRAGRDRPVALSHDQDDAVEVPFTTFKRDLARLVTRTTSLFGSGSFARVYRSGPAAELVGERTRSLETRPAGGSLELVEPEAYEDVDPDADVIPATVKGTIAEGAGPGDPLAVSVNGRIVASGAAYEAFGATRVLVAIPPASLRTGANEIEVLGVERAGAHPRLRSLGGTGS